MKEFKGTKGNWGLDKNIPGVFAEDKGEMGNIICLPPEGFYNSLENWEANARLIAAAPELLDALQEMVQWFKNESTDGIQDDAINNAKEAIKKALAEKKEQPEDSNKETP